MSILGVLLAFVLAFVAIAVLEAFLAMTIVWLLVRQRPDLAIDIGAWLLDQLRR